MYRLFINIYNISRKYKWPSIIALVLVVGTGIYFSTRIRLVEDMSKIIPANEKISKMNFVFNNSKFMDKLIFNISLEDTNSAPNPELLIDFAQKFTDTLQKKYIPSHIKEIKSGVDDETMLAIYDLFYENLPVFLSDEDYLKIDRLTRRDNIDATVHNAFKSLMTPAGFSLKYQLFLI
ncbi:MAG: hypothetical protein K9H64_21700 [Bacteroidales bacterium]|nr:hypothetical protein [Bacteroidales bacterium]MCF8458643.1 hypothetical protein [Bacteroidales bacterium]